MKSHKKIEWNQPKAGCEKRLRWCGVGWEELTPYSRLSSLLLCLGLVLMPLRVAAQATNPPFFSIERPSASTVVVSWSNASPGFILEAVPRLDGTALWQGVPLAPSLQGNRLAVTQTIQPISNGMAFFRLAPKGASAATDYLLAHQNPDGTWGSAGGTLFRDTSAALDALQSLV